MIEETQNNTDIQDEIDDQKPNFFSITPAPVRYNNKLQPMARIIYGEITALSNKYGYCSAKNTYFARVFELSIRQVTFLLSQIEKYNYIKMVYVNRTSRKIYPLMDIHGGAVSTEKRVGKPATPAKSYKPVKNPNVPIDAGAARLVKQMEEKMRQSMSMPVTPITTEIN